MNRSGRASSPTVIATRLRLMCLVLVTAACATLFATARPATAADKLVVYSGRAERLIKPVFDAFTAKTGIQIELLSSGTTELVNRLKAEGDRTPADLLLTNDAGSLELARAAGILRPLNMREVERAIPSQFRAADNSWVGLSGRFWVIVYNTTLVKPEQLNSLLDLANPQWKDKIAIPNAGSEYLQAGVSVIRATHGDDATKKFLTGLRDNAGAQVYQKSSQIVDAIAKGQVAAKGAGAPVGPGHQVGCVGALPGVEEAERDGDSLAPVDAEGHERGQAPGGHHDEDSRPHGHREFPQRGPAKVFSRPAGPAGAVMEKLPDRGFGDRGILGLLADGDQDPALRIDRAGLRARREEAPQPLRVGIELRQVAQAPLRRGPGVGGEEGDVILLDDQHRWILPCAFQLTAEHPRNAQSTLAVDRVVVASAKHRSANASSAVPTRPLRPPVVPLARCRSTRGGSDSKSGFRSHYFPRDLVSIPLSPTSARKFWAKRVFF